MKWCAIETMKIGGEKIVRTEKEVILEKPDKDAEAKREEQDRPANAPSLRRPGEDPEDAPKPAEELQPLPPATPPDTCHLMIPDQARGPSASRRRRSIASRTCVVESPVGQHLATTSRR